MLKSLFACLACWIAFASSAFAQSLYHCGEKEEKGAFSSWSGSAGLLAMFDGLNTRRVERQTIAADDGVELKGFVYRAKDSDSKQAVLIIQGNAMLAKQLERGAEHFANYGYDTFVFDYRGYGATRGRPSSGGIMRDYQTIARSLRGRGYSTLYVYGASFGAIVAINAFQDGQLVDRMALDAMPDELGWVLPSCPTGIDPINRLPVDASDILLLYGEDDHMIGPSRSRKLRTEIGGRGGKLTVGDWGHPTLGGSEIQGERTSAAARFFAGG